MKAHFRFIGNNKMKSDFCFIDICKTVPCPRAVATCCSRPALRRDLISADRNQRRSHPVRTLARLAEFPRVRPRLFSFSFQKNAGSQRLKARSSQLKMNFRSLALFASFSLASSFSQDAYCDDSSG
jgi:hypothetical protein